MLPITKQIRNHAITELKLTCCDVDVMDNIDQVSDALMKNNSILVVECGDDFLGCLRNQTRSRFLRALCEIQCLRELRLYDGLLSAFDVAQIVSSVKNLQILTMKEIVLQGVQEDFDALEMALQQHPTLKKCSFEDCRPAFDEISIDLLIFLADARDGSVLLPMS